MASSFFLYEQITVSFSSKMFINESYRAFLFDAERKKLVKLFNWRCHMQIQMDLLPIFCIFDILYL